MCRYVTDPSDGSRDRLHWYQAIGPTVTPSLLRMMTRSQLRLIANFRRVWRLIDWQTVGAIVRDGLIMTVALAIVCASYIAKDTVKAYTWISPRLANLLQHPVQTLQNGPKFLYGECLESVLFSDDSTKLQLLIVTAASECQMFVESLYDFIGEIKYNLSRFNVGLYGTNLRLQWGSINYSLVAFKSGNLYIRGQRMI